MILLRSQYDDLLRLCNSILLTGKQVTVEMAEENNIEFDLLMSIYHQLLVKRVKALTHQINMLDITRKVSSGIPLFDIATSMGFSPYKLAKMYTEHTVGKDFQISKFLEDSDSISDQHLRADIIRCCADDNSYSIENELIKHCVGCEYESILVEKMTEKGLCFETETEMRQQGKSKTPDALLLIPMCVYDETGTSHIVNWIDSKGMFGDEDVYYEHVEQLKSYCNRYGTGMVIYWHGFVESIRTVSERGILVLDGFPEKWLFPTGELADGNRKSFDV